MTGFRNAMMGAAGAAGGGGYSVDNSIVLDDGGPDYLSNTFSSAGNRKTWTVSFWFKRGNLGIDSGIFGAGSSPFFDMRFDGSTERLHFGNHNGSNWDWSLEAPDGYVMRDPHAWYHFHIVHDTTETTSTDRFKVWINGESLALRKHTSNVQVSSDGWPSSNFDGVWNNNVAHYVGRPSAASYKADGYVSEFVSIDGAATAETSTGEYATSGVWRPIELDTATLFPNPTITDNSVNFDGSNDYLTRGGALTGLSDGDAGSTSFWFKFNGGNGSDVSIFTDNAGHVHIRRASNNTIRMLMHTSGATELVDIQTSDTYIADGNWHHCMASWNTTSDTQHLYIDGVDQLSVNNSTTGTIDYTQTDYAVGARTGGTNKINSDLAEFYFTNEYLDLSQSSNRLKFLTADGGPASLGSDGSTPTGTAAVVYLSGATSTWHTNDGSGGGFTENGALTDGSAIQGVYGRNSFYLPFSAGSGANLGASSVSARTFTPVAANYTYNSTYLTIGSGTINNNGSPGVSGRLNNPFNGDFTFSFTATAIAGSIFGVFDATELSSFSTGTDDGGLDSMTNSWWYDDGGNGTGGGGTVGNGHFMYGNSSQTTGAIAAGSAVTIERTGSTIKITDDSSDAHSFSQTFLGPVYIMIGHRNITSKSMDYDSVSMNGIEAFAVTGSPTQSSDTPTVNAATFSPLSTRLQTSFTPVTSDWTFTNGNRTITHTSGASGDIMAAASQLLQPGQKYHFEVITESMHSSIYARFALALVPKSMYEADSSPLTGTNNQFEISLIKSGGSGSNTAAFDDSALTAPTNKPTTNSRLTFEVDMSTIGSTTVRYYFDGSLDTTYSSLGFADEPYYIVSFTGVETDRNGVFNFNFGSSDFTDTPTTGHIGLTAKAAYQASAPAIEDGTAYFQAITWSGDNNAPRSLTFSGNSTLPPDFMWAKRRNSSQSHTLVDEVRGDDGTAMYSLKSDSTGAELDSGTTGTAGYFSSLDADGFTLDVASTFSNLNDSGSTYVGWGWKAGGEPTTDNIAGAGNVPTAGSVKINGANSTSNLAGSIPATRISANTTAGFSIVSYTGTGSAASVAHELGGQAPDLVIIKKRNSARAWPVAHSAATTTGGGWYGQLDVATNASNTSDIFNGLDSTIITLGTNDQVNGSGDTYIAYCFRAISGYSAFGSYEGNGSSSDGPLVITDFKPAFVIVKNIDTTGAWLMFDNAREPANVVDLPLEADDAKAEAASGGRLLDFLSNGFKPRGNSSYINSSNTFIYMAFAEHPFAGSSPATAR